MTNIRTFGRLALAGALALGLVATPALAQRDPAYEAAFEVEKVEVVG